MKQKELINQIEEMLGNGIKPVMRFINGGIEDQETGYESGMMCKILSMNIDEQDEDWIVYKVFTDFSDFEKHNESFMTPDYFHPEIGEYTAKWNESSFYPKNKRVELYLGDGDNEKPFFEIIKLPQAYIDYIDSRTKLSYLQWLEEHYSRGV